ncbi:MAG: hypothetical protein GEV06_16150 [Luteitalea sp.]|nr:hypothetical protein [Luteitalea sp.]
MKTHPYIRAYMAGITLPTLFLLVILTAFVIARYVYDVDVPVERVVVFPMAAVPNSWGAWNILYVWLRKRVSWPIGLHGALLPLLLVPAGYLVARAVGVPFPLTAAQLFPVVLPLGLVAYYLLWKYLVGSLNDLLGIG